MLLLFLNVLRIIEGTGDTCNGENTVMVGGKLYGLYKTAPQCNNEIATVNLPTGWNLATVEEMAILNAGYTTKYFLGDGVALKVKNEVAILVENEIYLINSEIPFRSSKCDSRIVMVYGPCSGELKSGCVQDACGGGGGGSGGGGV